MPQNTMKQRLNSISQLAKILVARRKAMRMSQQALAAKLGIGQAALSQIEGGSITLSVRRLLDIANVLDLEVVIQNKQNSPKTDW